MGMQKTKLRAREIIFWPNMNAQIENMISNCDTCLRFQNSNQKEELINSEIPTEKWQIVGTDIFHFKNNNYLMVVDYFTKYIEMAILPDMSSNTTINILKSMFARHGIPLVLRSDGGPQYKCRTFKEFSNIYNFEHRMSSPNYPKSNGMAERHIQTLKRLLKKADYDNRDPYLALIEYRNTPISPDIGSPNKLLFGRNVRGILPYFSNNIDVDLYRKLKERQQTSKSYYDISAKNSPEFETGDRIRVQNSNKEWESAIVLNKSDKPRRYNIMKGNGRVVDRNRSHLIRDSNDKKFEILPEERMNEWSSNENMIKANINVNNNNNNNIVNEEEERNITNNDGNEMNVRNENTNHRPMRKIRKPSYLNDYITE